MTAPDDVRARFEAIFSQPPFDLPMPRWGGSYRTGQYQDYNTQCAWEGYRAAHADLAVEVRYTDTPPTESGWYWHWDGECHRMHFVFNRPGHAYLCTEGEPYGPGQKRNFQAVQRMGGKWSTKVEPPALAKHAHQEKP